MRFKFLFALGIANIFLACNSNAQQVNLSVDEFQKAIAQSNIQLLDVRTPSEYQSGHLKGALLADWTNPNEFQTRAKALDKSKPVYTYCLSGGRSGAASEWLRQNGYTAYNLSGGMSAWKRADKPVEQAVEVAQISMEEYLAQIPKDKTVLVDFGAVWCPPCKKMAPVLDSLVKTNGSQFLLVKIDGGQQTSICKQMNVDAFPTFIVYIQGKETWRKQGIVEAKELLSNF